MTTPSTDDSGTIVYFDEPCLGFVVVRTYNEERRADFLNEEVDKLLNNAIEFGRRLHNDHDILTIPVRIRAYLAGSQPGQFRIYCRLPLAAPDSEIPALLPRLNRIVDAMGVRRDPPLLGE